MESSGEEDNIFESSDEENREPDLHAADEQCSHPHSTPLYPGAIITVFMTHLLLFQYSMRHSLTKKALEELLQLISVLVPPGSPVPKSASALTQYFVQTFPDLRPSMQQYCSNCHKLLSPREVCECSSGVSQFINIPLAPQLKARLEG